MDIVSSFMPLLKVFTLAMTKPTASSFLQIINGWIFAPKRTIWNAIRIAKTDKHHSAYYRVFANAAWCVDQIGLAVFDLVVKLAPQAIYDLIGDDTLVPKSGLKVYGSGMHRDACNSSRGHTSFRWGHCWVVLCVSICSRKNPSRRFTIPILMRLYRNQKTNQKLRRKHRKKTALMLEMICRLNKHAADKKLRFIADSAYTGGRMLCAIPRQIEVVGRITARARLCEGPPPRTGCKGRPRRRGAALPNPAQMLAAKGLRHVRLKMYANTSYHVRITSQVCRLHLAAEREVKVVVIKHLRGGRGIEVFYSTDVAASEEEILQSYGYRWPVETMFHDSKGHLGLGEAQNRVRGAVRRTSPTTFYMYGLIVLWHEYVREKPDEFVRNWPGKTDAAFSDMLASLRSDSLEKTKETIFGTSVLSPLVKKLIKPLEILLALAA